MLDFDKSRMFAIGERNQIKFGYKNTGFLIKDSMLLQGKWKQIKHQYNHYMHVIIH